MQIHETTLKPSTYVFASIQ